MSKVKFHRGFLGGHRSHKDLVKDAAPHYKKARRFYEGVAHQLVQQGNSLDVFACALDQVGFSVGSSSP